MKYSALMLVLTALGLTSCTGLTGPVIMGADAAGIYLTKPDKPPAADVADQIPPHQSWCYRTAGNAQCFAHPQDVPPERLISVDPQNAYPIDLDSYREALLAKPVVATGGPQPILVPGTNTAGPTLVPDIQVEKANLKQEVGEPDEAVSPNSTFAPAQLPALQPPGSATP